MAKFQKGNTFWQQRKERKGGQRPMYDSPEKFKEKFEEYCDHCDASEGKERPTMSGAAWYMGFASRQSMYDYEKKEGFSHVVNRVKLFIERHYEQQVAQGRGDGAVVFMLKNFGWSDKQEIDHQSSDGSMRPTTIQLTGPDDDCES